MINWRAIIDQVNKDAGLSLKPDKPRPLSGGCINQAYVLGVGKQRVFVKLNDRASLFMFEAEAEGLAQIAASGSIRVPGPLSVGRQGEHAYIALEYIKSMPATDMGYETFGRQLAEMHRYRRELYGSTTDNTIGSTPQVNHQERDWVEFWRRHRLVFQLDLARKNGAPTTLFEEGMRLAETFHQLFQQSPAAACLHGDLWQGNWAFDDSGNPFIFDPAQYFGDRETDIAMTRLFGGAPPGFYRSYQAHYPLEEGYPVREKFYNIYHVVNHFNLFGGGYASQAIDMIRYVLSELK